MERLTGGFRPYLLLSLLCALLYLPGLAAVPPLDRDESRFVQATRQMVDSGDYVRIQFQDEMRAKKPVGAYWLQSLSVRALSDTASSAVWPYRLPSALAAWGAVLLCFAFGRILFGPAVALAGAAVLGGSLMLVSEGHQAKTDAILLLCTVAAQGVLGYFYLASRAPVAAASSCGSAGGGGCGTSSSSSSMTGPLLALLFWTAQGAAILVKGPVVPMVSLLTVLVLCIADRKAGWLTMLRPLTGVLVTIAIAAPWFAAISSATGGAFVGEAVKQDLLPKLLGAQESHGGVPGTYLLIATLTFWPGSLLLWPALVRGWGVRMRPEIRFALAWLIPAWLVFELIPTKLPHYVLPTYPALALLVGWAGLEGHGILKARAAKLYYGAWALVGIAVGGVAVTAPAFMGGGADWSALPVAAAIGLAAVLAAVLAIRERPAQALAAVVLCSVLAFPALFQTVLPHLDRMWVSRALAASVQSLPRPWPVALAGYSEPSAVFLLGTETVFTDGAGAAVYLAGKPGALVFVEARHHDAFLEQAAKSGLTARPLAEIDGFNYSRGKPVRLTLYGGAQP